MRLSPKSACRALVLPSGVCQTVGLSILGRFSSQLLALMVIYPSCAISRRASSASGGSQREAIDDPLYSAHSQRNSCRGQFLRGSVDFAAERYNAAIGRHAYPASVDAEVSPVERILDVFLDVGISHDLLHTDEPSRTWWATAVPAARPQMSGVLDGAFALTGDFFREEEEYRAPAWCHIGATTTCADACAVHRVRPGSRCGAGAPLDSGRRMVNSAPRPFPSLFATTDPPCASTRLRTIARPRPNPPADRSIS